MEYEEKCMKFFIKIRNHLDCRVRYTIYDNEIRVYYYYDDKDLFDVYKDISILQQFVKKCKFLKIGWIIELDVDICNKTGPNYSDILLNRYFNFLTRLDIRRQ